MWRISSRSIANFLFSFLHSMQNFQSAVSMSLARYHNIIISSSRFSIIPLDHHVKVAAFFNSSKISNDPNFWHRHCNDFEVLLLKGMSWLNECKTRVGRKDMQNAKRGLSRRISAECAYKGHAGRGMLVHFIAFNGSSPYGYGSW